MVEESKDRPSVESIKPTEKELKEQVKELASKEMDIHFVGSKDPKFEYRWINKNKQNLEMKKLRGWEPVSDKAIKTLSGSPDSTHQVGDLILARMPKEKYEKIMGAKKALGDLRRKVTKERFREEGKKMGVKTFDERE